MLTHRWFASGTPKSSSPARKHRRPARRLQVESLEERYLLSSDVVLQFNAAVLDAIRADKPVIGFTTRDLAIVHAAIYDAVNDITHTHTPLQVAVNAPPDASPEAAAAAAGLVTGTGLFPDQENLFKATYQAAIAGIPDGQGKADGIALGRFVGEEWLILRSNDGSDAVVDYVPGDQPGDWRPTPPGFQPAQTPQWPFVTPFALDSGSQFRPGPPPALTSPEYTANYNEVMALGRVDSTVRTPEQTEIAQFWEAKAGTPQIPGYWNEIAASAAQSQGNTLDENARLFAELNVTLADDTIAFFDTKYTYNRWRPVTAIELADETGNPHITADPNWLPLLNTAPHPSYVSAHGATSGAASTVLADFFGTDNISFSLTSEDLVGDTHTFSSFSAAATQAMDSVVFGGVHFRSDNVAGNALGHSVAQFVNQNFFQPQPGSTYQQTNIVSNIPGLAAATDPNLINPWGLSLSPTGQFRVSDNGVGLSTVYDVHGNPHPVTVGIPLPAGSTSDAAAPTGNVRNTTSDFVISENGRNAPAEIIFATEDGTITAWNSQVDKRHALIEVDNSGAGAVYKALTLGSNSQGNFIYATNFFNGTVDVFDSHFQQVQLAGSFSDPNIPDGFAPFGIRNINGTIFVTYAKQNESKHDDVAGPGNGFIDEFDTDGNLIGRFATQGTLNSPHGTALAPADFGQFSNALLVGNFGDGRINAFDPTTGAFLGQLADANNQPITNVGIWGMTFGNGAGGTQTNTLYFAAGIDGEQDGLLASISLAGSGSQGRGSAVRDAVASDLVFALLGRPAEQPGNTQPAQGLESRDRAVASSPADTAASAGNQVANPLPEPAGQQAAEPTDPVGPAGALETGWLG